MGNYDNSVSDHQIRKCHAPFFEQRIFILEYLIYYQRIFIKYTQKKRVPADVIIKIAGLPEYVGGAIWRIRLNIYRNIYFKYL